MHQSPPFPGNRAQPMPSLAPGLLLIGAGVLLLAVRMEWISTTELWKLWPVGLILAGIAEMEKWWREQR